MKNHILKLFVLMLSFGLMVSVAHAEAGDDSDESTSAEAQAFSPETPEVYTAQPLLGATPGPVGETEIEPEFSDFVMADPLLPLNPYAEAVQAGASANGPIYDMNTDGRGTILPPGYEVADDMYEAGYMAPGMDPLLAGMLVANTNVDALFKKYASLRAQRAITLPEEFRDLVGYVMGYIKAYSRPSYETDNGISNWNLAVQIVKASFCYGNDPFMLTAKMRAETNFNRTSISSGDAVGFSQMTGPGIGEVKDQLSGNSRISMPNARRSFQMGARCYAGVENWVPPVLNNTEMKKKLRSSYRLDISFGQIMMKAYASYTKATGGLTNSSADIKKAYASAFVMYNGDRTVREGSCLGLKTAETKLEYSCDIISYFTSMSTNWDHYMTQQRRRARLQRTY